MSIDLKKKKKKKKKTRKRKWFYIKKARSRRYLSETITDGHYADDLALLANTPTQAKFLLHSLKQTAEDSGLYVNTNKTEYMYFKRKRATSTLRGMPLKFLDKFTYIGSNISSNKSEINIRLATGY